MTTMLKILIDVDVLEFQLAAEGSSEMIIFFNQLKNFNEIHFFYL
jgi:hypothetical protein